MEELGIEPRAFRIQDRMRSERSTPEVFGEWRKWGSSAFASLRRMRFESEVRGEGSYVELVIVP